VQFTAMVILTPDLRSTVPGKSYKFGHSTMDEVYVHKFSKISSTRGLLIV
jgi:hypothetical protein